MEPRESDSPDQQHLFDQLDEIVDTANDTLMNDALDDQERRFLQAERESAMVQKIAGLLDEPVAAAFRHAFQGVQSHTESANDVLDALLAMQNDPAISEEAMTSIDLLIGLDITVLDASFTEQTTDGELLHAIPKKEVQTSILTNDIFSPELKRNLIAVVDEMMPGASLDVSDPDSVGGALHEKQTYWDAFKDGIQRRHAAMVALGQLSAFEGDPEYVALAADVCRVAAHEPLVENALAAFEDDSRLRLVGVDGEQLADVIRAMYRSFDDGSYRRFSLE